jgi:hypothetical protein
VRISEFDRDELQETSVIGARQFEQGWISTLLDLKQNSGSAAGIALSSDRFESNRSRRAEVSPSMTT